MRNVSKDATNKRKKGPAEILIIICLCIMIITSFAQIILRNFFHTGISGADSLIRHMVLWVVFAGAAIAAKDGTHIKIDAVNKLLPDKWLKYTDALAMFFSTAICLVLMWASYLFVKSEFDFDATITFFNSPAWLFEIIIPAGYFVIAVYCLIRGIRALNRPD